MVIVDSMWMTVMRECGEGSMILYILACFTTFTVTVTAGDLMSLN